VSKYNKIALKNTGIQIRLVAKIEDVASELFG
jgi:DNA repair protein RadA/Sms